MTFPSFETNTERLESFVDEVEKWQQRGAEQAEKAVDETARLMRSTVDYSLQLQSELSKQAIENTRKTLEMFSSFGDTGQE